MRFGSKGLKILSRRAADSIPDSALLSGNQGGSKPPSERQKKTKMKRAKRRALAVASHTFDVVREISDVFGPLKSVVNGVGHVVGIVQNARRCHMDARSLRSEVDAFRSQVDGKISCTSPPSPPVVDSLVRLDRELDDIEAIAKTMSQDGLGSRILHWKEREGQLRVAESKFRVIEFSINCSLAALAVHSGSANDQMDSRTTAGDLKIGEEDHIKLRELESLLVSLQGALKILTLISFFGSYGSMESLDLVK